MKEKERTTNKKKELYLDYLRNNEFFSQKRKYE
jgi:hypothetical protein